MRPCAEFCVQWYRKAARARSPAYGGTTSRIPVSFAPIPATRGEVRVLLGIRHGSIHIEGGGGELSFQAIVTSGRQRYLVDADQERNFWACDFFLLAGRSFVE